MSSQNLISANLDENTKTEVITKIREINSLLPFTINLSADDKQGLVVMGDKSIAFVEKALEMAKSNKELIPPYLDMAEMENDLKTAKNLAGIIYEMEAVLEKIRNTYLAAGSDAFVSALTFYNVAKSASKAGVPGLNSMLEELKQRFPGKRGKADIKTVENV